MKRILFILTATVSLAMLLASHSHAQQPGPGTIACTPAEKEGIVKTLDIYKEGNRKADGKILAKAFAETATVSSNNNGQLVSISIQAFCDRIDSLEPRETNYTLTACYVEKTLPWPA